MPLSSSRPSPTLTTLPRAGLSLALSAGRSAGGDRLRFLALDDDAVAQRLELDLGRVGRFLSLCHAWLSPKTGRNRETWSAKAAHTKHCGIGGMQSAHQSGGRQLQPMSKDLSASAAARRPAGGVKAGKLRGNEPAGCQFDSRRLTPPWHVLLLRGRADKLTQRAKRKGRTVSHEATRRSLSAMAVLQRLRFCTSDLRCLASIARRISGLLFAVTRAERGSLGRKIGFRRSSTAWRR